MENQQDIDRSLLDLRRGIITLVVMMSLREENHGYAVRVALSEIGLLVKEGTLYPLLKRLESYGVLSGRWDCSGSRMRKFYRITEFGAEKLRLMYGHWSHLVDVVNKLSFNPQKVEIKIYEAGVLHESI